MPGLDSLTSLTGGGGFAPSSSATSGAQRGGDSDSIFLDFSENQDSRYKLAGQALVAAAGIAALWLVTRKG